MNNQFDAKKIPKFLYLLLGTIIVLVLFIVLVATPLIKKGPTMQENHQTHLQTIREYDNALKLESSIEAEIKKNQEEFKAKEKELFVDLDTSSKEIEEYCRNKGIDLINYNLSEPKEDSLNRVSTGGYPVYSVNISLSYKDTYEKTLNLLKYLENGSNGCYYVKSCSLTQGEGSKSDEFDTSLALELYYYDRTAAITETTATEAATEEAK